VAREPADVDDRPPFLPVKECGRQACVQRNAPSSTGRENPLPIVQEISANGVSARIAALLTRKSSGRIPDRRFDHRADRGRVGDIRVMQRCRPPAARIRSAVSSASLREVRALTITAAPPAAIAHAIARRCCARLPVTRATFPASSAEFAMSRRNVPRNAGDLASSPRARES
jgi:hypothetical protein